MIKPLKFTLTAQITGISSNSSFGNIPGLL